jgi:hypothetical protein
MRSLEYCPLLSVAWYTCIHGNNVDSFASAKSRTFNASNIGNIEKDWESVHLKIVFRYPIFEYDKLRKMRNIEEHKTVHILLTIPRILPNFNASGVNLCITIFK